MEGRRREGERMGRIGEGKRGRERKKNKGKKKLNFPFLSIFSCTFFPMYII